mgnify:FL=1
MDNSEFSVEELSAQIGMSRSGLYKKLMQITGKSPLEFMRILRLKRGRKTFGRKSNEYFTNILSSRAFAQTICQSFLKRSLDICHPNIRKKKKNELLN